METSNNATIILIFISSEYLVEYINISLEVNPIMPVEYVQPHGFPNMVECKSPYIRPDQSLPVSWVVLSADMGMYFVYSIQEGSALLQIFMVVTI